MLNAESVVLQDERDAAFSRCMSELHQTLHALQRARSINTTHGLGLELPAERQFLDAMNACAHAREKERT